MSPVRPKSSTLIWRGPAGEAVVRMGGGAPWLVVGADRRGRWVRIVRSGDASRPAAEAGGWWPMERVFDVRTKRGLTSRVWVDLADGSCVTVAFGMENEELRNRREVLRLDKRAYGGHDLAR